MKARFEVELIGANSLKTPFGVPWGKHQKRVYLEGDSRLDYYRRSRAFKVTGLTPLKVEKVVEPAPVPAADNADASGSPLTEASVDLLDEKEISKLKKVSLIEYAEGLGLEVSDEMTKKEITELIDALR